MSNLFAIPIELWNIFSLEHATQHMPLLYYIRFSFFNLSKNCVSLCQKKNKIKLIHSRMFNVNLIVTSDAKAIRLSTV